MENNFLSQLAGCLVRIAGYGCLLMALAGCASLNGLTRWIRPEAPPKPQPSRVVTGSTVPSGNEPVWIKPVLGKTWVGPQTADDGSFVGGHYIATVVEPGRWATQEEAELSGRSFLRTEYSQPILPEPPPENLPPRFESLPAASVASLGNQMPRQSPVSRQSQETLPSADYYEKTNEVVIRGIPSGTGAYSVQTPKGPVLLRHQGNELLVEYGGKTHRHSVAEMDSPIRIKLEP